MLSDKEDFYPMNQLEDNEYQNQRGDPENNLLDSEDFRAFLKKREEQITLEFSIFDDFENYVKGLHDLLMELITYCAKVKKGGLLQVRLDLQRFRDIFENGEEEDIETQSAALEGSLLNIEEAFKLMRDFNWGYQLVDFLKKAYEWRLDNFSFRPKNAD